MVKGRRFSLLAVLIVAILLAAIGIERTASNDQPVVPAPKKTVLVNEQPLETAQRFSRYVGSKEEDEYSREAIRVADRELDLAFNTALRQAQSDPGAAANPGTRDLRAHARDLEEEIKKDQAEVKQMTSALESKGKNADDVQEQLDLTQAELALHQEELDDAKQDLERTGDDTEMKIRRMLSDHEAAEHSDQGNTSVAAQRTVAFQVPNTMVAQIALWRQLGKRLFYLAKAQQLALSYSQTLRSEHDQLEQKLKLNVPAGEAKAPIKSIADLKRLAGERESLAEYDKRARAQQQLAQVYGEWSSLVTTQRTACVHGILLFVLSILLIALVLMGIDAVIDHFLLRMAPIAAVAARCDWW